MKNAKSFFTYVVSAKPSDAIIVTMFPIIIKFLRPTFYMNMLIIGDVNSIAPSNDANTIPTIVSVILG